MPALFKRINSQFQPITNVTFTYALTGGTFLVIVACLPFLVVFKIQRSQSTGQEGYRHLSFHWNCKKRLLQDILVDLCHACLFVKRLNGHF